MPYDINGERIPDNEDAERRRVYCVRNAGEWHYIDPDVKDGDDVNLDQCEDCGNSESFTVRTDRGRPHTVVCDPEVISDTYEVGGCGRVLTVSIRPVGNEHNGVVMP